MTFNISIEFCFIFIAFYTSLNLFFLFERLRLRGTDTQTECALVSLLPKCLHMQEQAGSKPGAGNSALYGRHGPSYSRHPVLPPGVHVSRRLASEVGARI